MAPAEPEIDFVYARPIFCSVAKLSAPGSSLALKRWVYATTTIIFDLAIKPAIKNPNVLLYLNTSYGVTLVDKVWRTKKLSFQKINIMPIPLKVKGISTSQYESKEFALIAIYISGLDQNCSEVYTCIKCKLYLVEKLKANMLNGNNVFCIEGFLINFTNASAHIPSCGVDISINVRDRSEFLKQKILAHTTIFIPPKSKTFILFQ